MFSSSSRKPYTAVTVQIERLTSPEFEENDVGGIVDLIEVIRIQDTGPTEAARAIRKKLKYGSTHRQLRALTILDGLMQNAGGRFQRTFADEPLLERLRLLPRDDLVDAEVRQKCKTLFRQWSVDYQNTRGLEGIVALHKELPKKAKPSINQSKVLRETEAEARADPFATEDDGPPSPVQSRKASISTPSSSSPKSSIPVAPTLASPYAYKSVRDKKGKRRVFDLQKEKPKIMQVIANGSVASTNLMNALKLINREHQRPSEDIEVMRRFETCKMLRRQVLRYIQLVENDELIGSLLSANDDLVKVLMSFEIADKSIEDDSDSEAEGAAGLTGAGLESTSPRAARSRGASMSQQMASMSMSQTPPTKPPRPHATSISSPSARAPPKPESSSESEDEEEEEDDEDNPFGDRNEIRG